MPFDLYIHIEEVDSRGQPTPTQPVIPYPLLGRIETLEEALAIQAAIAARMNQDLPQPEPELPPNVYLFTDYIAGRRPNDSHPRTASP